MFDRTASGQKPSEDDKKFEGALLSVLQQEKRDYPTVMGGFNVASGNEFPVWSPIDKSIRFGMFQEPEAGIARECVSAASRAFGGWASMGSGERASIFAKALENVKSLRYRLAATVVVSSGMTREEALSEVDRLTEILESETSRASSAAPPGKPKGVWAVISTHNSPLASPVGFAAAAMLAGNTVVVMPSVFCPVPVYSLYRVFEEAGLPPGVMNVLVDRRRGTMQELANDDRLAGVVASGSGSQMDDLMFLQVDDELMFVNEPKGMNPIMLYKAPNAREAAREILESAFIYSGQRLHSCSKVVVTAEEQKELLDALLESAKGMVIDDPSEKGAFAGPLISESAMEKFLKTVESRRDKVVFGGTRVRKETTAEGFYVIPAIMMGLNEEDDLNYMDTGLPILVIQLAKDLDDAIEKMFQTECGLSAGIFSRDPAAIELFKASVPAVRHSVNEGTAGMRPAQEARMESFLV
ncbi:MAG: aldehyde dehydrogenase family protein [Candidatus Methanomethylophilaceae archaeon]|jgi:acyl-CoA reductase-like NAD-dependent aldehyde dehydrogenase|nr:aldehyde dehydrogenase family protein [Candidatus Methanomethylophilaceae archaeon]NLF33491.1 aldehyde dehydrogenase family protein [Thermoplasmatales archaeon]